MSIVKINGIDLYYEIHGKGAPLLLIAGLASDSQSWLTVLNELSKHYQVIVFDNRGTGRTTPHEIKTSIELMSADCMDLIGALGIEKVNILGHSMGGFIALDCAIRYPQNISRMILAATSASSSANHLSKSFWSGIWFVDIINHLHILFCYVCPCVSHFNIFKFSKNFFFIKNSINIR